MCAGSAGICSFFKADNDPSIMPFANRFWAFRVSSVVENAGAQAAALQVLLGGGDLDLLPAELRRKVALQVYQSRIDVTAWHVANEAILNLSTPGVERPKVIVEIITPLGSTAFRKVLEARLSDDPFAIKSLFLAMKYRKGEKLWANPAPQLPLVPPLNTYRAWVCFVIFWFVPREI